MNEVISHLDSLTTGENGHISYKDADVLSSMVAFDFKAMRGMSAQRVEEYIEKMVKECGVEMVFRHCVFIRDITEGKGERDVYYHYIYQLWRRYPVIVNQLIPIVCQNYGSWRDIKNMYKHYHTDVGFVDMLISIVMEQLIVDMSQCDSDGSISMLAKYLPGEKTSQKVLAKRIAKKMGLSMREYRLMKSKLTKRWNILERNLCGKTMGNIVLDQIPSRAMKLYFNTFMNLDKKGDKQRSESVMNVEFTKRFKEYMVERKKIGKSLNSRGIEIRELVSQILNSNITDTTLIETFVEDMKQKIGEKGKIIPVIDTSGSMYGNNSNSPIYGALGLGILLSMTTVEPFKNRFITFSDEPTWFKCNETDTFIERVIKSKYAQWGCSTDYYKTMKLILNAYTNVKIPAEETKDVILAVFSDMQFNQSNKTNIKDVMEQTKQMFAETGISTVGKPYPVPKIIFWNLRTDTKNCPVQSNKEGVTMISGFNQIMMKTFIENPHQLNPEQILKNALMKPRYDNIGEIVRMF